MVTLFSGGELLFCRALALLPHGLLLRRSLFLPVARRRGNALLARPVRRRSLFGNGFEPPRIIPVLIRDLVQSVGNVHDALAVRPLVYICLFLFNPARVAARLRKNRQR